MNIKFIQLAVLVLLEVVAIIEVYICYNISAVLKQKKYRKWKSDLAVILTYLCLVVCVIVIVACIVAKILLGW